MFAPTLAETRNKKHEKLIMPLKPVELFCCYSRTDETLARKLKLHLKVLEREKYVRISSAWEVPAGRDRLKEIEKHFQAARVILLLLSADFLADDDCFEQMRTALRRQKEGQVRVIPVLLRPCKLGPFSGITTYPRGSDVTKLGSNLSFLQVADEVEAAAIELRDGTAAHAIVRPAAFAAPAPPRPYFIAQLCDRVDQKEELRIALEEQMAEIRKHGRVVPLVCIVHGPANESPEGFKQRLKNNDICELLSLERDRYPIKSIDLRWPSRASELANPVLHLQRALEENVLRGNQQRTLEEVFTVLARHQGPVMFSFDISTENWTESTPQLVRNEFLPFWRSLPPINSHWPVIVGLFISYDDLTGRNDNLKLDYARRNSEMRRMCDELRNEFLESNHDADLSLRGVVLFELGPIKKTDVDNWIDDSRVFARFCARHLPEFCNPEGITMMKGAIARLYRQPTLEVFDNSPVMPMEDLAEKLAKLLDEYRCRA